MHARYTPMSQVESLRNILLSTLAMEQTLPSPNRLSQSNACKALQRFFTLECRMPRRTRNAAERGFTLLELLVVLAILGLLVAFVAPAALRQLGSAKHKIAEQSIERIAGILDIYRLDVGTYPTTDQGLGALATKPAGVTGWNGPYIKDANDVNDPWGRPYIYRSPSARPGMSFDITTLGADGKPGGDGEDADITNH
jgi:general secretion pathway protein G